MCASCGSLVALSLEPCRPPRVLSADVPCLCAGEAARLDVELCAARKRGTLLAAKLSQSEANVKLLEQRLRNLQVGSTPDRDPEDVWHDEDRRRL